MTPTTTRAGGPVLVEVPDRVADGDSWTLTDLSGTVVGTGDLEEVPALPVTAYTAVDNDTYTMTLEAPDLDSVTVGQWLHGAASDGAPWTGYVVGVEITEPDEEGDDATAEVTIDRPVGPEPASVWSQQITLTVPAVADYGTLSLSIEHGDEIWTSAVEVVRSPLALRLTVADLLNQYPEMAGKRTLFASPSVWDGLCRSAAELVDQEIRVRGDRTKLLLGDSQCKPALVRALRYVLAENGAYSKGEEAYPLEAQKAYRDRLIATCNALFSEAAYRSSATDETASERVSLSTRRCTR